MKILSSGFALSDPVSRSCLFSLFIAASLIFGVYFIGNAAKDHKERIMRWGAFDTMQKANSIACKNQCRPPGTEALPQGIIAKTSNLEMRPLWTSAMKHSNPKQPMNLLAIAVGIKQKDIVDKIIKKFPPKDFAFMLFHYDGVVDEWKDLEWAEHVIHVSAVNQTKWWFAKRFLHPDIVADYNYIFLWDEDIGVENFNPRRYLSIVKDEGLEISQPALDPIKSEVHHPITARRRNSKAHRRMYKFKGSGRCDDNSTGPPCIGWVEMMAPVFSRAAWRCSWYMIQNDLIHAWGLDMQLGYCAQGDRTKKVGVVDSQFIVHMGLPTLGVTSTQRELNSHGQAPSSQEQFSSTEALPPLPAHRFDNRPEVRRQSYIEMQIFRKRWKDAVEEDKCWVDPYQQFTNQTSH